jgi:hypothetical protein
MIMGTGYAKAPEVVTSYAKPAPSAGGSKDIQDIAYPSYRDAAAVLAGPGPGAAGTAVEFTGHRVVSSLEFRAIRVVFWEILEAFAEPCPSGQELRVVQSREVDWVAWLHGLPRLSCTGWRVVAAWHSWSGERLSPDQECKTTMRRTV